MKRVIEKLSTEDNQIDLEKLISTLVGENIDIQKINQMIKGANS